MQVKPCRASHGTETHINGLRRRDVLTGTASLAAAQLLLSNGMTATAGAPLPAVAGSITPLEVTELGRTGVCFAANCQHRSNKFTHD
jgi:hypothetical protein